MSLALLGSAGTFTHEVAWSAGQMSAARFTCEESGRLEELKFKTGATANTCTGVWWGLFVDTGGAPGRLLEQVFVSGTPAINSTLTIPGFNFELEKGITYQLGFVPIGGTLHFKYAVESGGTLLCQSTASTFTELASIKPSEWKTFAFGPIAIQGLGSASTLTPRAFSGWLGLQGNSSAGIGNLGDFLIHGVVYDRGGAVEYAAGNTTLSGLKASLDAGMKPIVPIEDSGYPAAALPATKAAREAYAKGFVETVQAALTIAAGRQVLFEITNEPWLRKEETTGKPYAELVAETLARCEAAGIPLSIVYVGATGKEWVTKLYEAVPELKTKVAGWYLHPYGPPNGALEVNSDGIQSVPAVRAEMASGQSNIIVSEIGVLDPSVNGGEHWVEGHPEAAANSAQAGEWMTEILEHAGRYRAAGWLKACVVYARSDGAWATQLAGGALTAVGKSLTTFGDELLGSTTIPLPEGVLMSVATHVRQGIKTVAAAGTAVRLEDESGATSPVLYVIVTALSTNEGTVVAGGKGVVAATGTHAAPTRKGVTLAAGASVALPVFDVGSVWIDSTTNGDGVTWTALAA